MCPGGYEVRSFPGFFVVDSAVGDVRPCDAPSTDRCIGYNATTMSTDCGVGYEDSLCKRCVDQYYETSSKTCEPCPEQDHSYDLLLEALWPFATVLLVSSILMFVVVFCLERRGIRRAKSLEIAGRQTREFGIWVVLSAQVMASASSSPAPDLPKWILSVYTFVSFFNFDTSSVVHESCMNENNPFLSSIILFSGILGLTLFQGITFCLAHGLRRNRKIRKIRKKKEDGLRRKESRTKMHDRSTTVHGTIVPPRSLELNEEALAENSLENSSSSTDLTTDALPMCLAHLQGNLFVAMSFAFPLVSRHVLKSLHCVEDTTTGEILLADASHRIVCWGDVHGPLAALSLCVLLLYGIFYPVSSCFYLRNIVQKRTKSKARLTRWEHFIGDDYKPEFYWFRHLYWLVNFALLFVYEFVPHGVPRFLLLFFVFTFYSLLLLKKRPFSDMDQWKLWVRLTLVVCSILIALLNVVRWSEDAQATLQGAIMSNQEYRTDAPLSTLSAPSPSSSSSSSSSSSGSVGSLVIAYFLFVSCMLLPVILPLSFFYTNYGLCNPSGYNVTKRKGGARCKSERRENGENEENGEIKSCEMSPITAMNPMEEEEWIRYLDEGTGCYYFYRASTGATKWEEIKNEDEDEELAVTVNPTTVEKQRSLSASQKVFTSSKRTTLNPLAGHEKKVESWDRHYDDTSGCYFVVSSLTGASKWEEVVEEVVVKEAATTVKLTSNKKNQLLKEAARSKKPAVMGWIELSGPPTCYCHLETGEVKFERPKNWVAAMRKVYSNSATYGSQQERETYAQKNRSSR